MMIYQGLHTGSLLSVPALTLTGLTACDTLANDVIPCTGDDAVGAELAWTGLAFTVTGKPALA